MSEPRPLPPALRSGPFTVADALAQDVPRARLNRRDLAAPFRGVRRSADDPSWLANHLAYAALMSDSHVFSHLSAARLHAIPLPTRLETDERVHVTLVQGRAPRGPGVVGHTTGRTPSTRLLGRLRVTSPARTWADLAALLTVDELVIAGDRLLGRPEALATPTEMYDAVADASGLRGRRNLAQALTLVRAGSRSPRETRARLALVRAGLPEPELNAPIPVRGRTLHGDLAYRPWRVLLEYEGDQHRTDPWQWAHDLERYNDLAETGWLVIRASKKLSDVGLATRTRRALISRGWEP